jgi:hypothetical protein
LSARFRTSRRLRASAACDATPGLVYPIVLLGLPLPFLAERRDLLPRTSEDERVNCFDALFVGIARNHSISTGRSSTSRACSQRSIESRNTGGGGALGFGVPALDGDCRENPGLSSSNPGCGGPGGFWRVKFGTVVLPMYGPAGVHMVAVQLPSEFTKGP